MLKLKWKKGGFTLAEVIVVCSIFAVIVVGMLFSINRAFVFLNNIRLQVIATNLAREGVEMMYNMRDTNWRRHPSQKDLHFWGGTPFESFSDSPSQKTQSVGWWFLREEIDENGDSTLKYIDVMPKHTDHKCDEFFVNIYKDPTVFFESIDAALAEHERYFRRYQDINAVYDCAKRLTEAKVEFTGTYSYYSGGAMMTGDIDNLFNQGGIEFYRMVRAYGMYCKNSNETNNISCGVLDPKELRFCVKVFYRNSQGKHAKELCSIMTNFLK